MPKEEAGDLEVLCKKCILPETFENISFNDDGVCNYCEDDVSVYTSFSEVDDETKKQLAEKLDNVLKTAKGKYYDVAIGFSGGKDSAYLCMKIMEEYDVRVLGISIDHGFFPTVVDENIRNVAAKLNMDLLYHTIEPAFMERFFKYKFEHAEKSVFDIMCADCSRILEGTVMKMAAQMDIPVVLIGLSPEQTNRYFFQIEPEHVAESWIKGDFTDEAFTEEDRRYLWTPQTDAERNLQVFLPYHVWDYDVNVITRELKEANVLDEERSDPLNTECKILQTMRHIDKKNLGYDPRAKPFSDLVRRGEADRDKMISKIYTKGLDQAAIQEVRQKLGLDFDKLIRA